MNERPRPPIAVALHYNVNGGGAPRVVAKGGGQVAEKIVETAREHNVPLQEDAALAGALSKLDIGHEIPKELYVAVAHVLAFAWSIAGKSPPPASSTRPEEQTQRLPALGYSRFS